MRKDLYNASLYFQFFILWNRKFWNHLTYSYENQSPEGIYLKVFLSTAVSTKKLKEQKQKENPYTLIKLSCFPLCKVDVGRLFSCIKCSQMSSLRALGGERKYVFPDTYLPGLLLLCKKMLPAKICLLGLSPNTKKPRRPLKLFWEDFCVCSRYICICCLHVFVFPNPAPYIIKGMY